jgi:hypothetical protein
MISVRTVGFVQAISAVRAIGEAGKAVNGPLAAFGSRLPYARFIETGRSSRQIRRAGPARMFERGVADAAGYAREILPAAIVKGPAFIGPAKRKIRDRGLERIRALTPVRSGKLRDSVSELNRPGIV